MPIKIRIRIRNFKTGSADPDPDPKKIGPDPQHWYIHKTGLNDNILRCAAMNWVDWSITELDSGNLHYNT